MTLDGYCDHTAGIADEELHDHYTNALNDAGVLVYGRTTYQLMEDYWPNLVKSPSGEKAMDDFAVAIDNVPKVVFSRTLKSLSWPTARLADRGFEEELTQLKQQPGKDIYIGSPGLIAQATKLDLIDRYELAIHPVIIGHGLVLFKNIVERKVLKLLKTKTFGSGVVLHYYDRGEQA